MEKLVLDVAGYHMVDLNVTQEIKKILESLITSSAGSSEASSEAAFGGFVSTMAPLRAERRGSLVEARMSIHPALYGSKIGKKTKAVSNDEEEEFEEGKTNVLDTVTGDEAGYGLAFTLCTAKHYRDKGASAAFAKLSYGMESDWDDKGASLGSPHIWFKTAGSLWEGKSKSNSNTWVRKDPLASYQVRRSRFGIGKKVC